MNKNEILQKLAAGLTWLDKYKNVTDPESIKKYNSFHMRVLDLAETYLAQYPASELWDWLVLLPDVSNAYKDSFYTFLTMDKNIDKPAQPRLA